VQLRRIGILTAIVYAANALHYRWNPHTRNTMDDVFAWITVVALGVLYVWGYRSLRASTKPTFRQILLPAVPLVVLSFFTIPYDSTDVFLYSGIGWAQSHYALNPYSHVLRDIHGIEDDPMMPREWLKADKNSWLDLPLVYGFAFALLARSIAWLGSGNWWLTLGLFKLVNIAAYIGICRMLWTMADRLGDSRPDATLYLFSWSPLILQHHIANAHNDLLVGGLVVLAAFLVLNGRSFGAPIVLAVAMLIKYITLPLIPLYIWFVAKREGRYHAIFSTVLAIVVVALLATPFIPQLSSFRFDLIAAQLNKTTPGSLFSFIYYLYRFVVGTSLETFGLIVKTLLWTVSAALIAWKSVDFFTKGKPELKDLISASGWILFMIVFVASSQFYSWYIGMLLPVALLMGAEDWIRSIMIRLSATHVLSLTSLSRKGIGYFVLTTGAALLAPKDRAVRGRSGSDTCAPILGIRGQTQKPDKTRV
jgi:hypothetical protein